MNRWLIGANVLLFAAITAWIVGHRPSAIAELERVEPGINLATLAHLIRAHVPSAGTRGKALFIAYLDRTSGDRFGGRVKFLCALAERYAADGARCAVVVSSRSSTVSLAAAGVSAVTDQGDEVAKLLSVNPDHGHGAFAVLDSQGKLLFRSLSIPVEDEIRQLVQKHTLGRIDQREMVAAEWLRPGQAFPVWPLEEVARAGRKSLPADLLSGDAGTTFVLFAASCSSCQLHEYLAELDALRARVGAHAELRQPVLIFDRGFDVKELRALQSSGRLPSTVYLADVRSSVPDATQALRGFEVPLNVLVSANGVIESVRPLRLL